MKKVLILFLVVLIGCTPSEEDAFQGEWQAKWKTDPAGYGELAKDLEFEMDGSFDFDEEKLTVSAFGYEGCVFGTDTLRHTISWKISGDTLEIQNSPDEPGIQYKILSQTDSEIKLQLVEDIYITLSDRKRGIGFLGWIAIFLGIGILGTLIFIKYKPQ